MRAWHVIAIEELELSSRGSVESLDVPELSTELGFFAVSELLGVSELSAMAELSVLLLSEEISSLSGPLALFGLLLSSQAASVKVRAAAVMVSMDPIAWLQDDVVVFCFMVILLLKFLSICS